MCHAVPILLAPCLHCNHHSSIHADAQYLILLHTAPCSSTYLLLHEETGWRLERFTVPTLLWSSSVLKSLWRKSVAALFHEDPNKTPSNNGSNFNTKTSASRTLSLPDELETQKFVNPVRFAVKPKMGHLVWNAMPDLPNLFCVPSSACTFVYQWKCCWSWGRQLLYIWMLLSIVI